MDALSHRGTPRNESPVETHGLVANFSGRASQGFRPRLHKNRSYLHAITGHELARKESESVLDPADRVLSRGCRPGVGGPGGGVALVGGAKYNRPSLRRYFLFGSSDGGRKRITSVSHSLYPRPMTTDHHSRTLRLTTNL